MTTELLLMILNIAGICTAALAILLVAYTFHVVMQIHPKQLKQKLQDLKQLHANSAEVPQLRKIVEFTVPREVTEQLQQWFFHEPLHPDWIRLGEEDPSG